jgi:hypothetical protein
MIYPTFVAYVLFALLLVGFIILHVLAALYHQFVKKDVLLLRMSFGRRVSDPSAPVETATPTLRGDDRRFQSTAPRPVIGQTRPVKVAADEDVPVVEVDGRVAVAGDQRDLVAKPEPVSRLALGSLY